MRSRPLAQLVVMDQRGLGSERNRTAVAECPFAAIAIRRSDVAVDVETAPVVGPVLARAVHQVRTPQREVAGLEQQVDGIRCRQPNLPSAASVIAVPSALCEQSMP